MDESSSTIVNTDNSISSKETAINTSQNNIDYYNQITPFMEKHMIKAVAQNLRDIIIENIRNNQMNM